MPKRAESRILTGVLGADYHVIMSVFAVLNLLGRFASASALLVFERQVSVHTYGFRLMIIAADFVSCSAL